MSWADCSIPDDNQHYFYFAKSLINGIRQPNVGGRRASERVRFQILTRNLIHTEACSRLNNAVLLYKFSPQSPRKKLDNLTHSDLCIILEGIEIEICRRLRDIYLDQVRALHIIGQVSPEADGFLNLYTAALTNAVKTYVALARIVILKLEKKQISVSDIASSVGVNLIQNNKHFARELYLLPLPVFNLLLNSNGGNIPVGAAPYRFDESTFIIGERAGALYLLPTTDYLEIFTTIANHPDTTIKSFGRLGKIEVENFEDSYNAVAMGCPAFKSATDHEKRDILQTVGSKFISNLNNVISELLGHLR